MYVQLRRLPYSVSNPQKVVCKVAFEIPVLIQRRKLKTHLQRTGFLEVKSNRTGVVIQFIYTAPMNRPHIWSRISLEPAAARKHASQSHQPLLLRKIGTKRTIHSTHLWIRFTAPFTVFAGKNSSEKNFSFAAILLFILSISFLLCFSPVPTWWCCLDASSRLPIPSEESVSKLLREEPLPTGLIQTASPPEPSYVSGMPTGIFASFQYKD